MILESKPGWVASYVKLSWILQLERLRGGEVLVTDGELAESPIEFNINGRHQSCIFSRESQDDVTVDCRLLWSLDYELIPTFTSKEASVVVTPTL